MNNLVLLTNELVPVYKNQEGSKLVNARELHEWLGIQTSFKDWVIRRIVEYAFIENKDFSSFLSESTGGRPSKEYIITLDMAKELSMVERTEKGKQARQYFIKCEENLKEIAAKQLSPMEQLRLQYQVLGEHEEKLNNLDSKVETLALTMNVNDGQAKTLKMLVEKRVRTLCWGSEGNAYLNNPLRKKVYRYVWRSLKDYFNVTVYHNILRKDFEDAKTYICKLTLQGSLLREVQESNNQIVM